MTRVFEPIQLQPGEFWEVRWVVDQGCRLVGSVVDPVGTPIAYAQLTISTLDGPEEPIYKLESDRWGAFSLPDIGAGAWVIEAKRYGRRVQGSYVFRPGELRPSLTASEPFTIGPGDRRKELSLVCSQPEDL